MDPYRPYWHLKHDFRVELSLRENIVIDVNGTNHAIQKLAHVLTQLPEQTAILHIIVEAEGYDIGFDGSRKTVEDAYPDNVYLEFSNRQIRLRPSLGNELFEQYRPVIETEMLDIEIDGAPWESIHKIANTITEDPDIFNKD